MGGGWNPKATPAANFFAGYRQGKEYVMETPNDRNGFMISTFKDSPRVGPYMRGQACGSAISNLKQWINDGCRSRDVTGMESINVLRNMGKYETSHIAKRLIDEAEMLPIRRLGLRLVEKIAKK